LRLVQKNYPYAPGEIPYIDLYNASNIASYYNYTFQVGDFLADLNVDLLINLPDVDHLYNFNWTQKEGLSAPTQVQNITQLTNNTFRLVDVDVTPNRLFIADFMTNHTIEVVNEFSDYWRRDYLKDGTSTRIRDFDISVIGGPETIVVSNFLLNLTEFHNVEFIKVTSSLDRILQTYDLHDIGNRTQNGTRIEFLRGEEDRLISDYYLVKGEVDTISVTYTAPTSIAIKIVDKINTPLKSAEVKLNFGNSTNATFGTMISKELVLPYAFKITNSLGLVTYPEVPRGNYTVDVYYKGNIVASGIPIDTYTKLNVVFTIVPHFPGWVILFAATSAIIGAVGFIIFKKAQS
jgi:hypothetical protein